MKKITIFLLIFYLIVSGLIFSFLIPPFQKPDEFAHFEKTISLVNLDIFCLQKKYSIPANLYEVFNSPEVRFIPFNNKSKMSTSLYRLPPKTDENKILNIKEGCRYKDNVGYIFAIISYSIFSSVPINGFILFGLMRFFIFIVTYTFLIYFILKIKNNFFQIISFFILSLPMTINQMSAFSYDVGHLFFGLIFLGLFFEVFNKKKFVAKDIFFLTLSYILFYFSKPFYDFYIFLFFLIPKEVFKKIKLNKMVFIFFLFVFILWVRIQNFHSSAVSLGLYDSRIQKEIIFENFVRFLSILITSLIDNFRFYTLSTIGILGWLDFELNFFVYFFFITLFGGIVFYFKDKIKFKKEEIIIYLLVAISIFFTIFVGEFLYWTVPGDDRISGVQGRYFIILIPLITLIFIYLSKKIIFTLIILLLIIFLNIHFIYNRYYDFSVYAKPTINLNTYKKNFIKINPYQEKIFTITKQPKGACYGVYLLFKNRMFFAPIKVEIYDKENRVVVYFTQNQTTSREMVLSKFNKRKFTAPIFVKVLNKYSDKPLIILDKVALNCIQDYWY